MSAAFTPVAATDDLQLLGPLAELTQAVAERSTVATGGPYSYPVVAAGTDIQAVAFWKGMQDILDALSIGVDSGYLDYDATPDLGSATGPYPWMTSARCRLLAGLNSGGYRRATSYPSDWTNEADAAYSHGSIQAGDIIGPWLWQDLQRMASVLRWTWKVETEGAGDGTFLYPTDSGQSAGSNLPIYADCRAEMATKWTGAWEGGEGGDGSNGYLVYAYSGNEVLIEGRQRVYPILRNLSIDIPHAVQFCGWSSCPQLSGSGTFQDIDGLGLVQDEWKLFGDTAETSDADVDGDIIGSLTSEPIDSTSISSFNDGEFSAALNTFGGIVKWNFTNRD